MPPASLTMQNMASTIMVYSGIPIPVAKKLCVLANLGITHTVQRVLSSYQCFLRKQTSEVSLLINLQLCSSSFSAQLPTATELRIKSASVCTNEQRARQYVISLYDKKIDNYISLSAISAPVCAKHSKYHNESLFIYQSRLYSVISYIQYYDSIRYLHIMLNS